MRKRKTQGDKKTLLGKKSGKRFKIWFDDGKVVKGPVWAEKQTIEFVKRELENR